MIETKTEKVRGKGIRDDGEKSESREYKKGKDEQLIYSTQEVIPNTVPFKINHLEKGLLIKNGHIPEKFNASTKGIPRIPKNRLKM